MKAQRIVSIVVLVGLIISAAVWYGINNHLLPEAAGLEAEAYDRLFNTMVGIAFGVFLLIEGLLVFAILVFQRRPGDEEDGPGIGENLRLEILWTAIPIVTVLWLSIYSTLVYNRMVGKEPLTIAHHHAHPHTTYVAMTEGEEGVTEVDVTAMQFAWIFTYPGTEVTSGELHVPLGKKVRLNMQAMDVIHAFWVPELRLKQDAIPGMTTHLEFTPTRLGTFNIVCTELCGAYHGGMRAEMVVDTPADYQKWLAEQAVAQKQGKAIAIKPGEEFFASIPHHVPAHIHHVINEELVR
ncbi:MAG: cytochrome c oxidase subunit II [Pseudanabaenaceae cyanobacterium SKYGB_i_bin29]|nr:cytochrome c oxidase subunit II [Pseudanabaenaceae cyanobacterium SKYG29]MDW8420975.1 cytochrome c oxidase subunit II [Pseudanabaenaceae cyanobacterium SKYGB_i_bin29]